MTLRLKKPDDTVLSLGQSRSFRVIVFDLQNRPVVINPASKTLAKRAYRTEFHCFGKLVAELGQVRLSSVFMGLSRPSGAI
jgi:hypothetical protein